MTQPINFNKVRKAKAAAESKAAAAQNRVRFGLPKAERERARLEAEKAAHRLDQTRRED